MSGLSEALVAAQMDMPPLHKDSEAEVLTKKGAKYRYTYLSLQSLLDAVLPVLNKHGLCVMQKPIADSLETRIIHTSGDAEVALTPLVLQPGFTAQEQGSAITYARRYALMSMLALAPDEDDDGLAASKTSGEKPSTPVDDSPEAPPPATEKPMTEGQRAQLSTTLKLLTSAFPEHPGEGRTWADVAKEHAGKPSSEMSMAEANELNDWLEGQFLEAQQAAQVPFG